MSASGEYDIFETYEATVNLRRGDGYTVRPECEALDGQRLVFRPMWQFDAEERPQYALEWAMLPADPDLPRWIASGDLADVVMVAS